MGDTKIKYQDIANRNGSEDLFKWYIGKGVSGWSDKEGILLSWSIASVYDDNQKHLIIPIGIVQENISGKVIIVPAERIIIKTIM